MSANKTDDCDYCHVILTREQAVALFEFLKNKKEMNPSTHYICEVETGISIQRLDKYRAINKG